MNTYENKENSNFSNEEQFRYERAVKKVKKQKGFFVHATVYVLVNLFLILSSVYFGHQSWTSIELYYTPIFWGIGLAAHGFSVFMPNLLFGKEWEERKIKQLMEEDRKRTNYFN